MTELAFLASDSAPLTKSFSKDRTGNIAVTPYPHVAEFTSHRHNVKNLSEFYKHLVEHAAQGHCLLKGQLQRDLQDERRANSTVNTSLTDWLIIDVDGVTFANTPAQLLKVLPAEFRGVSYILQYSPSMGVVSSAGLRAHLFFMLEAPILPSALKLWLQALNLRIPKLRGEIRLSRNKISPHWPLDITVAQNDKLIYIAPPNLGPGLKDPYSSKRIQLIKHPRERLNLNLGILPAEDQIRLDTLEAVNELRTAEGLPPRTSFTTRVVHGIEVLTKPGTITITGIKEDRGFTYLNLNGGDSWGYFFPSSDPTVLYNFKSEPNLLLKEIAPQFYNDCVAATAAQKQAATEEINKQLTGAVLDEKTGVYYLAFLAPRHDSYFRGFYDPRTEKLELNPTSSLTRVIHFLKQHGQPVGDWVPEWELGYKFDSDIIVDIENRFINCYQRSEYMRNARPRKTVPTLCKKLIDHALGYDARMVEHFLNWLAVIMQFRRRTDTAWVLSGIQGTGKGLIYNKIVTPIIGPKYAGRAKLTAFEKEFNACIEGALTLIIDESQVSTLARGSSAADALKEIITEPRIPIRRMRTDAYLIDNYMNLIICSNKHDPAQVDAGDRRYNVAPRQEQKLETAMTSAEIEGISEELYDMAGYLLTRTADIRLAATALDSDEKRRLQSTTLDTNEAIAAAILRGDLGFFWAERPEHSDIAGFSAASRIQNPPTYDDIMDAAFASNGEFTNMSRDHVEALFYYVGGLSIQSRYKFTRFAAHRGLDIKPVHIDGTTTRGLRNIRWEISDTLRAEWLKLRKTRLRSVS